MRDSLKHSLYCAVVLVIVILVLAWGNPYSDTWLLQCPLYQLTGIKCPFCGGQRAVYEILHLNIKEAWKLNPGLFVASPYLFLLLIAQIFPQLQNKSKIIRLCYKNRTLLLFFVLLLFWGIVRNLHV